MVAQLQASAEGSAPPSSICSATLLSLLPSLKVYQQYVSGYHTASQLMQKLITDNTTFQRVVGEAEAAGDANERLAVLLVAPVRRLPNYGMYIERMIKLTPVDAAERGCFCQALGALQELCSFVDSSLAEHESRRRVGELHAEFGSVLGPAMPHRRFLAEGELRELLVERGRATSALRQVVLLNDVLFCTTPSSGGGREAHDCISLAKVQVKLLPDAIDGPAPYAFELWSIAKIWRFGAVTEAERTKWVSQIQQQVRYLLASFKQRGKSLAFIPQNVTLLRERLCTLQKQRQTIEQQVVDLTREMSLLEEELSKDRQRLVALERPHNRRSASVEPPRLGEYEDVKERVLVHEATRASLQGVANKCIEELFDLSNILDATDEQHNDDSLLQYMLFSSA